MSGRDVQPTLERARPSCRALFSSGRFDRERARVGREALVQDPQAVPCEELRLGDLVILSRPAVARGERIGGGPIHHARLTELERLAGPSAPSLATPQIASELTPCTLLSLHAERRPRARISIPIHSPLAGGTHYVIENGSTLEIGPTVECSENFPRRKKKRIASTLGGSGGVLIESTRRIRRAFSMLLILQRPMSRAAALRSSHQTV